MVAQLDGAHLVDRRRRGADGLGCAGYVSQLRRRSRPVTRDLREILVTGLASYFAPKNPVGSVGWIDRSAGCRAVCAPIPAFSACLHPCFGLFGPVGTRRSRQGGDQAAVAAGGIGLGGGSGLVEVRRFVTAT